MSSTSEVGHAKNVANFQELIGYCTAYGTAYNPSKTALQLTSLNTLLASAKTELTNVTTAKNTFDTVTGDRQVAFEPLKSLATKVYNSISVTDATEQTLADAKTINNKLQGKRANPTSQSPNPDNQVSVSRQSYDSLTENFSSLLDLVSSIPSYTPNEADLNTTSLTTFRDNLQTANTNVINAEVAYSNARISRDNILYSKDSGLVEIAMDVKNYVKSVFGATSPQYKQVSGIKFTSRNN
ncbi:hypothetical protein SAMN05660477_03138 [Soonwooa buanensis]|uniref:Uncharacterized protein n=1 Tax=Soonwooa buanensis TaxID=619805 RepID=A0A1T5GU38_9FLAO|nr:hypothetical protein [Soonwooa buanensis]SKC11898.1 hypothetical protein SAMN05660477_03138 [Soonwooa buanensis]